MASWQAHQHCPDAVSAATICWEVLTHSAAGQGITIVAPVPGARLGGGGGVPVSRPRGGMPVRPATVTQIDEALAYRRQLGRVPGGRTGRYR